MIQDGLAHDGRTWIHRCVRCGEMFENNNPGTQYFCMGCRGVPNPIQKMTKRDMRIWERTYEFD